MSSIDLSPADSWKLRTVTLRFSRVPLLMGIVNATPDSFSDGGKWLAPEAAVEHALRLAAAGADLLDIGGESTRPGAEPVSAEDELKRVLPIICELRRRGSPPISIDTSKACVAREAIAAGAEVINDVTALRGDPQMMDVAVESGCGVCAMHMQGTPRTMQSAPTYENVVEDVLKFLRDRRDALMAAGIEQARIALDPGIGFGKTVTHNLQLLYGIDRLHTLGCPILVGHSRKRFLGEIAGDLQADRDPATLVVALTMAQKGVQILRVHDVAAVRQALVLHEAAGWL